MEPFTLAPAPRAARIVLVGSGEAALAALWSLAAAGAHIRWYADRADVGAEAVLASGLAGKDARGGLELSLADPRTAPLDGVAAIIAAHGDARDAEIAARARGSDVPVHVVGRPDLSTVALAELAGDARWGRASRPARRWAAAAR